MPQGVYVHIPFCKQACSYCNFHFSTNTERTQQLVDAIVQELHLRSNYLPTEALQSIYFGGGTPSLLSDNQLATIYNALVAHFGILPTCEVSIEVNPDDISAERLHSFRSIGFNRLSIGIQSFAAADLQFMNRAHNAKQALACLTLANDCGFTNYSADLIYGYDALSHQQFTKHLNILAEHNVKHLSCYALTVEPKTALHHAVKKGTFKQPSNEHAAQQFSLLMDWAAQHQYEHYEISNFAQANYRAVHNSSYWHGNHYLGLGPSAHSYNGSSRSWNIANNSLYISSIMAGELPQELEVLSRADKINEYIMTKLRLSDGMDKQWLASQLSAEEYAVIEEVVKTNEPCFIHDERNLKLSKEGKLRADALASDMFVLQ
ncbi:MAG: hypothetical protein RL660_236 [Bacteroidota bacterium]|jgi:oxygen-independent coproporphyrinogen-3 oxidase